MGSSSGVLLVDKPARWTSAKVVHAIRQQFNLTKAGHAGTLDPLATGLLCVCVNEGTKISRYLMHTSKTYVAVMRLGLTTDTLDADGQTIRQLPVPDLEPQAIKAEVQRFVGTIQQRPPAYSAVKVKGKPAYKYARQGQPLQLPDRKVTIDAIRVDQIALPLVRLVVDCGKGTYVRSLVADIGEALGPGACLQQLRRTRCGHLSVGDAVTLDALLARPDLTGTLMDIRTALPQMAEIELTAAEALQIGHGKALRRQVADNIATGDLVMLVRATVVAIGQVKRRESEQGEHRALIQVVRNFKL